MKIELENRQTLLRINRRALEALALAFLVRPGPPVIAFSRVTVVLTADAGMRALKRLHFGEDAITDVISQAYVPLPGEDPPGPTADVYINVAQARRVARGERDRGHARRAGRRPQAIARELALYLAHGIDHLRGGRDGTPAGRASMRGRDLRWVRWAEAQGLVARLAAPRRTGPPRPRPRRAAPSSRPPD